MLIPNFANFFARCSKLGELSRLWQILAEKVNDSEIRDVGIATADCGTQTDFCRGNENQDDE